MRVQSPRSCKSGGWYHNLDSKAHKVSIPRQVVSKSSPTLNADAFIASCKAHTKPEMLVLLAHTLGVTSQSLNSLGCVWSVKHGAWAFPMLDSDGEAIGVRLRFQSAEKRAVTGSRGGLFYSDDLPENDCCLVVEGPTDCAAGLTLGFWTIGRPSCNSGNDLIPPMMRRLGLHRAIIVADRDEIKNGVRAGIQGADRLSKEIGCKHVICVPPTKDLLEFLKRGGTKLWIDNDVNKMTWMKL